MPDTTQLFFHQRSQNLSDPSLPSGRRSGGIGPEKMTFNQWLKTKVTVCHSAAQDAAPKTRDAVHVQFNECISASNDDNLVALRQH